MNPDAALVTQTTGYFESQVIGIDLNQEDIDLGDHEINLLQEESPPQSVFVGLALYHRVVTGGAVATGQVNHAGVGLQRKHHAADKQCQQRLQSK
jgi:hypothetical protein